MSDPVSNSEIEDVLTSIRRLLKEDGRGGVAPQPAPQAPPRAKADPEEAKLVLTPSLRVAESQAEAPAPAEPAPAEALFRGAAEAPAPAADTSEASAPPAKEPPLELKPAPVEMAPPAPKPAAKADDEMTLEERIAELEAAIGARSDEWEPDGSEYESLGYAFPDGDEDDAPLPSFTDERAAFEAARAPEATDDAEVFTPSDLRREVEAQDDPPVEAVAVDEIEDAEFVEIEPAAVIEPVVEPEPVAEVVEPVVEAVAEPVAEVVDVAPEPEVAAEPEPVVEPEPEPVAEVVSEPEAEVAAEAEPEPEVASEPEPEPEVASDPEPEVEPETATADVHAFVPSERSEGDARGPIPDFISRVATLHPSEPTPEPEAANESQEASAAAFLAMRAERKTDTPEAEAPPAPTEGTLHLVTPVAEPEPDTVDTIEDVAPEPASIDDVAEDRAPDPEGVDEIEDQAAETVLPDLEDVETDDEDAPDADVVDEVAAEVVEDVTAEIVEKAAAEVAAAPADPVDAPTEGALVAAEARHDEPVVIDEDALREIVGDIVRSELQGELGERITRNVRKLVRREIYRALASKEFD